MTPRGIVPFCAGASLSDAALTPEHRLPRERAVEMPLAPTRRGGGVVELAQGGAPRTPCAGRCQGCRLAREAQVLLAPDARVETDVERSEATGDRELYRESRFRRIATLNGRRRGGWGRGRQRHASKNGVGAAHAQGPGGAIPDCPPAVRAVGRLLPRAVRRRARGGGGSGSHRRPLRRR